jgi:hypothetical protein
MKPRFGFGVRSCNTTYGLIQALHGATPPFGVCWGSLSFDQPWQRAAEGFFH